MKLLPKTDGYTTMISTFVSRECGFGLQFNDKELRMVNDRQRSCEWGEYLSKTEAIEVHGTSKKKLIEDKLTLVQFSDVEINKEGYWNNNQISLQVEDVYDVI